MHSEEARIGMRVRVRNTLLRAELRGREGKITERFGSPDYAALNVLLDDGSQQLFWHHELDPVDAV
jgi:hypothetical protein